MFQHNEGSLDRDIRLAVSLLLAFLSVFYIHGPMLIVSALLAIILFATAATGFCPIYAVLHVRTSNKPS